MCTLYYIVLHSTDQRPVSLWNRNEEATRQSWNCRGRVAFLGDGDSVANIWRPVCRTQSRHASSCTVEENQRDDRRSSPISQVSIDNKIHCIVRPPASDKKLLSLFSDVRPERTTDFFSRKSRFAGCILHVQGHRCVYTPCGLPRWVQLLDNAATRAITRRETRSNLILVASNELRATRHQVRLCRRLHALRGHEDVGQYESSFPTCQDIPSASWVIVFERVSN